MKGRKWFSLLMAVVLILGFTAGCKTTTPEPTAVPAEPTAKAVEPTAKPVAEPTAKPDVEPTVEPEVAAYDKAIYGDLENVDPSGQEVTYWYQHTGSREELMLSMIDEFNQTN